MQQAHHQPDGDGPDSNLINTLQIRTRRITTMARWATRYVEVIDQLRAEIAQLRVEVKTAINDNAELHAEVNMLRRITARRMGLDPDEMPPQHYIDARRQPQHELFREVTVDIDGRPWKIGLSRDRPTGADPVGELRTWQQNVILARELFSTEAVQT